MEKYFKNDLEFKEYISAYKYNECVPLKCPSCKKEFTKNKNYIVGKLAIKRNNIYCSKKCYHNFLTTGSSDVICKKCSKKFSKKNAQIRKTKNNFCSKSCAASYNNTNKSSGNRRSKLECYLEDNIRGNFPDLLLICNSKEIIGSELDFYFPELRLAIELNGVFHYEPIYGNDKLEKIQNNDQQKFKKCFDIGVELCVIDSSSCNYLNQTAKDKYWAIVKNIIENVYKRKS